MNPVELCCDECATEWAGGFAWGQLIEAMRRWRRWNGERREMPGVLIAVGLVLYRTVC